MFGKILILATVFQSTAMADLSAQDIRERLEIHADTYVLDESGKHVLSGPENTNAWRLDLETGDFKGNWSSDSDGRFIGIRQNWEVTGDGTIKVVIEEYASADKEHNLHDLIERKEFSLTNFEPIVWKLKNIKDRNSVVRFVPELREVRKPIAIDSLPVSGSKVTITDNAGYLWADGAEFNGKYVGLRSHRGSLALSYVPFKGAKEIGFVEGKKMTLKVDKKFQISLKSETSFLPAAVTAKVYAVYQPEKKSKGVNSLHTWDTNKEDRALEQLQK